MMREGKSSLPRYMLGLALLVMPWACNQPVSQPEPQPDSVTAVEPIPAPLPPEPLPETAPTLPPPAFSDSFATLHEGRVTAFGLVHGLGDRMDPNTILPYADTVDDGDAEPWHLSSSGYAMLLLREGQAPIVVVSKKAPFDFAFGSLPTRPPDAFESEALARLMEGETLVVEKAPGREVRMLGAVRAKESCRTCHKTIESEALMGAFSYAFKEMPDD